MQNNTALYGGGLYANGALVLTDTQFISNTTNAGGLNLMGHRPGAIITLGAGAGLYTGGDAVLHNGLFQSNAAAASGGGLWAGATLALSGTRFLSNTAVLGNGGGAATNGAAVMNGGLFQGNSSPAASGGGLYAAGGLTLMQTQFANNAAGINGGGLYVLSTLTATRSGFVNNTAQRGGGLYHAGDNADVINSLFARDSATVSGTALYLGSTGQVNLEYLTIGRLNFVFGTAIEVAQGNVNLFDSIVTSHSVGLHNAGGIVLQDYNLFFGTSADTLGAVVGGSHNATGDPKFVNVAQDNYRLGTGSAAIDKAVDLGVAIDYFGNARPFGAGFDIGFDEAVTRFVYLPHVSR